MGTSLILIVELLAAMLVLIPLNGLIINALSYLGQKLNLKREVLILLIIGIAVSIPELMIAINAVQFNQPELAIGNAIGSGLVLMALVAGLVAIYNRNFKTNRVLSKNQLIFMTVASLLNIILSFDGRISRSDGVLLIITYIAYLVVLLSNKGNFSIKVSETLSNKKTWLNIGIVIFGLAAAFLAAYFINYVSREIYLNTNFTLFFIGLVLLAPLGAIPELIFEFELNHAGKSNLSLGELFTSLVTNTTLVIGITALLSPINIATNVVYYFSAFFFALLLALMNYFVHSKNALNWREGLILVVAYVIFLLSAITLIFS